MCPASFLQFHRAAEFSKTLTHLETQQCRVAPSNVHTVRSFHLLSYNADIQNSGCELERIPRFGHVERTPSHRRCMQLLTTARHLGIGATLSARRPWLHHELSIGNRGVHLRPNRGDVSTLNRHPRDQSPGDVSRHAALTCSIRCFAAKGSHHPEAALLRGCTSSITGATAVA